MATQTEPQFKAGDRFFSHYSMSWGTVVRPTRTDRDQKHGVTGSKLPDTTWYLVKMDSGDDDTFDDAHGDWDMARMVPPHIAKRFGYGDDPIFAYEGIYTVSLSLPDCDWVGDADDQGPFAAVRDFQHQAGQHDLFVYIVKQDSAPHLTLRVDMADRVVGIITEKESN